METRAAALVALLSAAKLLGPVFDSAAERKAARSQARAAIAANPAAQALRGTVEEMESTAAAAAVIAPGGS
jgi:hypothetical protein